LQESRQNSARDWLTQGYIAALCLVAAGAAYGVGYTHGEMYGERTRIITNVETVEYPPAYAATCAAVLEAAWALEDRDLTAPAASPHLP
jgi:hypothetical protein